MRGIEQENICRIQWDDCPRQQFPNNFPRFPHVLPPFVLPNLNVGLGLAILTSEVNGNPTYLENYTNWYSKYTTLEASGLCGPVLSCYEVASQSACSDSDYCYLDGSYTPNGKRLCCYADMGKSSKSCFDVYGFENADALVYDTSLKRIVGGTMFCQASVNDVDWSHWTNQADGMRRWYTFDFTTDSCEIDTSKSTFHSDHCQLGYWTDEYISEGDGMCYKYPSSNVQTCTSDTVKCKNGYYVQYNGGYDGLLCTACPEIDMDSSSGCGDQGASSGGWHKTSCYAEADNDYCDKTGDFYYDADCKYTN